MIHDGSGTAFMERKPQPTVFESSATVLIDLQPQWVNVSPIVWLVGIVASAYAVLVPVVFLWIFRRACARAKREEDNAKTSLAGSAPHN